jgi:hypothetical protein
MTLKTRQSLERIAPRAATNADISRFAQVQPHQTVFMITRKLVNEGRLKAGRNGREWRFWIDREGSARTQQPT